MDDHEVNINNKTYSGDSKVTLKAKTLIWIIGALISIISTLATIGYLDIKNDIEDREQKFKKEKQDYREDIEEMLDKKLEEFNRDHKNNLKEFRKEDKQFREDLGEIKGDIKVILDRTLRIRSTNSNESITPTTLPSSSR